VPISTLLRNLLASCALAVLGACGAAGAPEVYVIKFPHVTAPATPKGQTAERFKALVEARFPGRVRVEIFPSAQLMESREAVEALAFGEIQMMAGALSIYNRLTPKFQIFDLPFLFPDMAAVERFQQSPAGQELLDALAHAGIRGITFWHNGMKQWTAPRPLRLPEDAAGLKFRIMESDVIQEQVGAVGGSPQKMAYGEVYQALQTGTVDAQENTWSNNYSSRFHEVQPYITVSNHGYLGYFVAFNEDFWESLPADLRDGILEVLDEVTVWGNERASEINDEARRNIIESGLSEVIELNPAELAAWREAMIPVWEQFREEIGPELIDAARALTQ